MHIPKQENRGTSIPVCSRGTKHQAIYQLSPSKHQGFETSRIISVYAGAEGNAMLRDPGNATAQHAQTLRAASGTGIPA